MVKMMMGELLAQMGSTMASIMFLWAMLQQYFPMQILNFCEKQSQKLFTFFHPYNQITFDEFTTDRFMRNEAYVAIDTYLASISSKQARRLKADVLRNTTKPLSLSMDDNEEVNDHFNGVKVYWSSGKTCFSGEPNANEQRFYKLTFHKVHRELIIGSYLNHVLKEGTEMKMRNRLRKLYTNRGSSWSHVVFEHPASFETLAMDPVEKKAIMNDLTTFSKSKDFYNRIGRAWKRGYLLYGPPGTGKSTMIAAMANFLGYDIYDLELTAVVDNTVLKKLLTGTSGKSIIVIEDIDCSEDLTGHRKKEKEQEHKVTLSGLLNSIDGLWSACGGEKLIVFTTNHVDKLDPALIRRGRMDYHIYLGYCGFEAFKVLARNYLYLESHELFEKIQGLLREVEMTPADVAENLMPKTIHGNPEVCLESLIQALEIKKDENKKVLESIERNEEISEEKKGENKF